MPINEYKCLTCERKIEYARRFSEPQPVKCDDCGGQLRQVYHPLAFRMRRGRGYSLPASSGPERHQSALIGEDELEGATNV
ncbi:MAG: hypothetical protein GY832_26280 [Chloroflexi bacterium]|nr:hypothetical protein [Chloroflexota bacterium]